jgi:hypothetical protein
MLSIVRTSSILALLVMADGGAGLAGRPAPEFTPIPPGFTEGTLDLKSAGALAFGPKGVLFVGDSRGGAVFGVAVDDATPDPHRGDVRIASIDKRIATALGTTADQIVIHDMAVNPATQHLFFSVSKGRGNDGVPAIVRSTLAGEMSVVPLAGARFTKLSLRDAPGEDAKTPWGANARRMSVTDLAFANGEVLIAGLSNEAFASTLRRAAFPFTTDSRATTLEVFHTSHGRYESAAPIETFLPFTVKGQPALLAGYGCAPLAVFRMADLAQSKHVKGETLAELGGGNRPSDMIAIERNGERHVIVANSDRTLMRLSAADIDKSEPLTRQSTKIYENFGTPYISIAEVGITQLDALNPEFIIYVQRSIDDGTLNVVSHPTKWL